METLKASSQTRRKKTDQLNTALLAFTGRNRGMSQPPIKRDVKNSSSSIDAFKQQMPTSLRSKIVGQVRQESDQASNRELKTISFANMDQYEEIFFDQTTPGLRPAEISIDERNEEGQSLIPVLKREGQFIRTYSPIKEYDLSGLEPPKVPNYRVYSVAGRINDRDMSIKILTNTNQVDPTTSQCYAACHGKLQCKLCTPTVRRDDKIAEANLEVRAIKPPHDMMDKYHRLVQEQSQNNDIGELLGVLGTQQSESSPMRNKDLQPDSASLAHMRSHNFIVNEHVAGGNQRGRETLLDVRENVNEDDDTQSEDLVSLDGSQKGLNTNRVKKKKQVNFHGEQRRASSLKPTDSLFFQSNLRSADHYDPNSLNKTSIQDGKPLPDKESQKSKKQDPQLVNRSLETSPKKTGSIMPRGSSITKKSTPFITKTLLNKKDHKQKFDNSSDLTSIQEHSDRNGRSPTKTEPFAADTRNDRSTSPDPHLQQNLSTVNEISPHKYTSTSKLSAHGTNASPLKRHPSTSTLFIKKPGLHVQKLIQEYVKSQDSNDPIGDIESITFHQLMQLLCPPNDQFYGCELLFPDTAFFDRQQGKATEIIQSNKDGFITSIKNEKRLKFLKIQTQFSEIVRERRRAPPPANRDSINDTDDQFFDRQTTNNYNGRTTFGSELYAFDFLKLNSNNPLVGHGTGKSGGISGANESGGATSMQRDRASTELQHQHETSMARTATRQSFNNLARSTFMSQARGSSYTKRSTTSQATKKVERSALLDLAIFRFEVDPMTLPNSLKPTHNTGQSTAAANNNTANGATFNEQDSMNTLADGTASVSCQHGPTAHQTEKGQGESYQIVKVLNETQFLKAMGERATSRQWRALDCIQTCIKAQRGLGKHLPIRFTMQLDFKEQREIKKDYLAGRQHYSGQAIDVASVKTHVPSAKVPAQNSKFNTEKSLGLTYDYEEIGNEYRKEFLDESKSTLKKLSDIELTQMVENKLKQVRPKDYCLRQVLKMCFYLQQLRDKEILQMNCDFFQDDNGEIWFVHATDILLRSKMKSKLELKQEESILEQQKVQREKRQELKRLEHAEWKQERKKLAKEEETRRNLFNGQMSQLSVIKQQRRIRRQVKEERTEKIKQLGKQIGIGVEAGDGDDLNEESTQRQLSAKELKIKRYTEAFHNYFMKQRKQLGVEQALLESDDSEIDEQLEQRIDEMIKQREAKDLEDRKLSLLNKKKLIKLYKQVQNGNPTALQQQNHKAGANTDKVGGTAQIVKDTIAAKKRVNNMWRELSDEKEKLNKEDESVTCGQSHIVQGPSQTNQLDSLVASDRRAQLARQFLNNRMRALRYENVISGAPHKRKQSDHELSLFEKGDYLTDQLMENRRKTGILKSTKPVMNDLTVCDSRVDHMSQSFHLSNEKRKEALGGRNTHLGFVDDKKQKYFNDGHQTGERSPSFEKSTTNTFQKKLTGYSNSTSNKTSLQIALKKMQAATDQNFMTARQAAQSLQSHNSNKFMIDNSKTNGNQPAFQKATLRYYAPVSNFSSSLIQKETVCMVKPTTALGNRGNRGQVGLGNTAMTTVDHYSNKTNVVNTHRNTRAGGQSVPQKQASITHVKNDDGSESIFLNKEVDTEAATTAQNFYQAPAGAQTTDSSQRGDRGASSAVGIRSDNLILGDTSGSIWGRNTNVNKGFYYPSTDQIINNMTLSNKKGITVDNDQYMAVQSHQTIQSNRNVKNQLYQQRSVSPVGKLSTVSSNMRQKKSTSYLRSIDRKDQERTHFFHLPEQSLPQSNHPNETDSLVLNSSQQKKRNATGVAGPRKKGKALITGLPHRQRQSQNRQTPEPALIAGSSRQQNSTNRTTLVSRYPAPIVNSSKNLSTMRGTREGSENQLAKP